MRSKQRDAFADGAGARFSAPSGVQQVALRLHKAGYQAFYVGGCVRDTLLSREPADWDVATDALPADVQRLFPSSIAVGAAFGTIVVPTLEGHVEVTTFRRDLPYEDGRHPLGVVYATDMETDLLRRDFTINAMAWDPFRQVLVDPASGRADLADRILRAVGDPAQRIREDALRLLRAVRFAVCLDLDIDAETWAAMEGAAHLVDRLSRERVRDELLKVLACPDAGRGLWMMHELGILLRILPELHGTERLRQGKSGAPTLLDHLVQAVAACPPDPPVRLAALLHDVGKLNTRKVQPDGRVVFHGHEEESARLAEIALRRLRMDNLTTARVLSLIKLHMIQFPISVKSLRRFLAQYGETWIRDLFLLRRADHLASGGDATPWIDEANAELDRLVAEEGALQLHDLAIDGHDIMRVFHLKPGPLIGRLLAGLYEIVLADPTQNQPDTLFSHVKELLAADDGQGSQ